MFENRYGVQCTQDLEFNPDTYINMNEQKDLV